MTAVGIGLIVLLPAAGLLAGMMLLTWFLQRELPAAERAAMARFVSHNSGVPAAWQHAAPYTTGTLALLDEFVAAHGAVVPGQSQNAFWDEAQQLSALRLAVEEGGVPPSSVQATSITRLLGKYREPLAVLDRIVRRPDYCSELFYRPLPFRGSETEIARAYAVQMMPVLAYEAFALHGASEGTSVALSQYPPLCHALPRTLAVRDLILRPIRISMRASAIIARQSGDSRLARQILGELVAVPPAILTGPLARMDFYMWHWTVSYVREIERAGFTVDWCVLRTPADVWIFNDSTDRTYPEWVRSTLPTGDPRLSTMPQTYSWTGGMAYPCVLQNPVMGFLRQSRCGPWSSSAWRLFFTTMIQDTHESPSFREKLTLAVYNLVRLELAAILYHADKGAWPASTTDLVPQYLPAVPRNPLGSGSYLWSPELSRFWVPGLDGKDAGCYESWDDDGRGYI